MQEFSVVGMVVAPYTGAWIEILSACGRTKIEYGVAPYTGAWIEICYILQIGLILTGVAPYTGAWIEIDPKAYYIYLQHKGRPLYGGVD